MKIVAISDTHGMHHKLHHIPDGDVLVHSGDCLNRGSLSELVDFCDWLVGLPHKHKIVVAGNHDWALMNELLDAKVLFKLSKVIYLEDSEVDIDGVKFYGSPWTPSFNNWAFMKDRGVDIGERWDMIPTSTDVLITHGPPASILDGVPRVGPQGCVDLLDRIAIVKPKLHIFGHIHEGGGTTVSRDGVQYVNASIMDSYYHMNNKPMVIEI